MIKSFNQKLSKILLIVLLLAIFPLSIFANVIVNDYTYPYPYPYNWSEVALFSLLFFLIMTLGWFISPLGVIFILSTLASFFLKPKAIRIVAWVFQGAVFVFTMTLGALGILYSLLQYGEEKYVFFISIISALSLVSLLMIGTIIVQIIWYKKGSNVK